MKMVVTVSLLFLLVADALIAQAQSKGDETDPFVGATIIGEKQVTAEIRITDIPEDLAPFKEGGFSKYVSVFGVHIFATPDARDEKLLHAAKVMAEYLDNDSDGVPENMLVVPSIYSSARPELDRSPVSRDHVCMISSFVRARPLARPQTQTLSC